ncbi:MAG: GtrA family protein [SAR324 cluster bacterium]|uniref:GtrA family protein n=1 Tax=SAR324 cluster bacterium TaxID=2024889 RepID=A0A7X9IJY4_9DELT|nr:GtrA family protein [SAR324 cluster bacterium]
MSSFIRFILVGAVNTVVGYAIFALLTYIFTNRLPYPYIFASILGNIIAITIAYINYKLFVFKTRGNYLKEYLRFYVVYGFSFILGLIGLPLLVEGFGMNPYVAGAGLSVVTVLGSFAGHRNYSFRSASDQMRTG